MSKKSHSSKQYKPAILSDLQKNFSGDIEVSPKVLDQYSHDTSLFEIIPSAVLFPKNINDRKKLIKFVSKHKAKHPDLSITARSGGTDMSGGAINDSLIVVLEKYFKHIGPIHGKKITAEPGVYYRDFEKETLDHHLIFPSYPASREICAMGGIVANNAGGEKSLAYGKTENHVTKLRTILVDGNEYTFEPLTKTELSHKLKLKNFEGQLYRDVFAIVDTHYDEIKKAKPKVTKNSTGYLIWDVWDRKAGIFDMTKLFIGSQGTLGMITEAEFALVDYKPLTGLLVCYVPSLDQLGDIISTVVPTQPTSFETFDDHTLKLAIKFFFKFRKTLGTKEFIKLALSFIPDLFLLARGVPKLIMLIEYEGNTQSEIDTKLADMKQKLNSIDMAVEVANTQTKSKRFWLMRRESFNLLRKNVKNLHTAPFIDDLVVPPEKLTEFMPKFREILERYDLLYTVAGHMGDGNFHVIPLMDLTKQSERDKIPKCMSEVDKLVVQYGGTLSGEHNDGLIRGPFLSQMYSKSIMGYFKQIKHIFDPQNIFNPHKKTDATWEYSASHMRDHF